MSLCSEARALGQVVTEGASLDHQADHLDRHAMILHGMLQEARQKAEAVQASMGAQVRRAGTAVPQRWRLCIPILGSNRESLLLRVFLGAECSFKVFRVSSSCSM